MLIDLMINIYITTDKTIFFEIISADVISNFVYYKTIYIKIPQKLNLQITYTLFILSIKLSYSKTLIKSK
mgnify:CR=1 FL=1